MRLKLISAAAAIAGATLVSQMPSQASAAIVYQTFLGVAGYCPTCAGTATRIGDDITIAGGPNKLAKMTWDTSNFAAGYDAQVQVEFFNVDLTGGTPALGSLFHSQTSTHFLAGGTTNSPTRSFVEIGLGGVDVPERFIYSIGVLNNNGSTNWNVTGSFAEDAASENEAAAQAVVGTNNETDFIFGDWVAQFGADPSSLTFQRLGMGSYQLGLPGNEDFAAFSNLTPAVIFESVPVPATLPLLVSALGLFGFQAHRRTKARRQKTS